MDKFDAIEPRFAIIQDRITGSNSKLRVEFLVVDKEKAKAVCFQFFKKPFLGSDRVMLYVNFPEELFVKYGDEEAALYYEALKKSEEERKLKY